MSRELTTDEELREALAEAHTIALLGAHPDPAKAAHYVPQYLHGQGYRIIPVNAVKTDLTLWGERVRGSLADIKEPVDIVDIFRRSDALPGHLDEILAMQPLPLVVWFQEGVRNDEVARALMARGVTVVQDRCTKATHMRLLCGD